MVSWFFILKCVSRVFRLHFGWPSPQSRHLPDTRGQNILFPPQLSHLNVSFGHREIRDAKFTPWCHARNTNAICILTTVSSVFVCVALLHACTSFWSQIRHVHWVRQLICLVAQDPLGFAFSRKTRTNGQFLTETENSFSWLIFWGLLSFGRMQEQPFAEEVKSTYQSEKSIQHLCVIEGGGVDFAESISSGALFLFW